MKIIITDSEGYQLVAVISLSERANTHSFQILKCEDLLSFFVFYGSKGFVQLIIMFWTKTFNPESTICVASRSIKSRTGQRHVI